MRRPDLFDRFRDMGYDLAVPSHVESEELIGADVRAMIGGLLDRGAVRIVRMNRRDEVLDLGEDLPGADLGECDAILTCIKMRSPSARTRCVVDDKTARAAARRIGIEYVGLAGSARRARIRGPADGAGHGRHSRGAAQVELLHRRRPARRSGEGHLTRGRRARALHSPPAEPRGRSPHGMLAVHRGAARCSAGRSRGKTAAAQSPKNRARPFVRPPGSIQRPAACAAGLPGQRGADARLRARIREPGMRDPCARLMPGPKRS